MEYVQEKVRSAFIKALGLAKDFNAEELVYNDYPGWDSVGHMGLVAALEENFDCMLEMDEILEMSSFARVVEIMAKYA